MQAEYESLFLQREAARPDDGQSTNRVTTIGYHAGPVRPFAFASGSVNGEPNPVATQAVEDIASGLRPEVARETLAACGKLAFAQEPSPLGGCLQQRPDAKCRADMDHGSSWTPRSPAPRPVDGSSAPTAPPPDVGQRVGAGDDATSDSMVLIIGHQPDHKSRRVAAGGSPARATRRDFHDVVMMRRHEFADLPGIPSLRGCTR